MDPFMKDWAILWYWFTILDEQHRTDYVDNTKCRALLNFDELKIIILVWENKSCFTFFQKINWTNIAIFKVEILILGHISWSQQWADPRDKWIRFGSKELNRLVSFQMNIKGSFNFEVERQYFQEIYLFLNILLLLDFKVLLKVLI